PFRPKKNTLSPESKASLPLESSENWATPDEVGRTTPTLSKPRPAQSPVRNVSLARPKVNTASPESKTPSPLLSSETTAEPSGAGRTTPILSPRPVGGGGGETPPGPTTMPLCVPLIVGTSTSLAVSDWVPLVRKVAVNVPTPPASCVSAGSVAKRSLLV